MDNRDAVIALQSRRIAELSGRLETVTGERDVLLLQLEQLRCQLTAPLNRSVLGPTAGSRGTHPHDGDTATAECLRTRKPPRTRGLGNQLVQLCDVNPPAVWLVRCSVDSMVTDYRCLQKPFWYR